MRIGIICPYSLTLPGGVQMQVLGLARALRKQGERVRVLAPCDGAGAPIRSTLTNSPRRKLNLFDATMLVMGGILGIGIFFNPAAIARQVPSEGPYLVMWALGALARCGM